MHHLADLRRGLKLNIHTKFSGIYFNYHIVWVGDIWGFTFQERYFSMNPIFYNAILGIIQWQGTVISWGIFTEDDHQRLRNNFLIYPSLLFSWQKHLKMHSNVQCASLKTNHQRKKLALWLWMVHGSLIALRIWKTFDWK